MRKHDDKRVDVGVLLAGGSSRRIGVDKRYLVLEGRTLVVRNLAFLTRHFTTVAISVGRGRPVDVGDAGAVEVVRDVWCGTSPLVGIASALRHFRRPLFAMSADLAFPDHAALGRVLAGFPDSDVAVPVIGEYRQPLFAAYGPSCLAPMVELLEAGRHRIMDILPDVRVSEVRFPDESQFRNINTMDDYRAARREAADRAGGPPGHDTVPPALVAVVGKSDSGKTTLIEKLVPQLVKLGLRVGTVKHDAHSFEIDHPGKDSWRHGRAGAHAYVIASPRRLAFITRLDGEMPLTDISKRFFAGFDLVVAEGYKRTAPHRVEVFRLGAGHDAPLCAPGEALAVVSDAPCEHTKVFAPHDAAGLARFLAARLDSLRRY